MNKLAVKVLVYLLAQIVDIYVDKVGSRIEMGVPHLLGYLYTADNFFGILHQLEQKNVYLRR